MNLYNVNSVSAWFDINEKDLNKYKVGDNVTIGQDKWQVITIFKDELKGKLKRV